MGIEATLKKIKIHVISNYQKLDINNFVLGECPYNHRCHLNAVQKVKEGKAAKVLSCITIEKDNGVIMVHFINQNSKGEYIDNTLGWRYKQFDYYMIREIEVEEQEEIWKILCDTKKYLIHLHSNWFERTFMKVNDELI